MLKVTPASSSIAVGTTQQFKADKNVTWSIVSNGTAKGTIDKNGLYKGHAAGTDTVLATPEDGSAGVSVAITVA